MPTTANTFKPSNPTTWPDGLAEALVPLASNPTQCATADKHLAERFGLSRAQVRYVRELFKLKPGPDWRRKVQEEGLGTAPDSELATRYGVSRQAIQYHRKRRAIPPAPGKVRDVLLIL